MSNSTKPPRNPSDGSLDLIGAIALGLLTVAAFVAQAVASGSDTTPLETGLFNVLQFILTAGFGWFGTRAISRREFEQGLRRFAVSAYRRISDIEGMVRRLQTRIDDMRAMRGREGDPELDLIGAVVEDTMLVVDSSIADWADVLGDELGTIEKIRELEEAREAAQTTDINTTSQPDVVHQLEAIDQRIRALAEELPAQLRFDAQREHAERRSKGRAAEWLANRHMDDGGLRLNVVTGQQYRCDVDVAQLKPKDPLFLRVNKERGVDVFNPGGVTAGRVLNFTPLPYRDFRAAMVECYGSTTIEAEFEEFIRTEARASGQLRWYRLKVVCPPRDYGSPSEVLSEPPLSS